MGVTHLLDTHVFLWLLGSPARVAAHVRDRLADPMNPMLVSAVSAMEVATKVRLGKLTSARHLVDTWSERVADLNAEELGLTTEQALLAGSLEWDHRDPFDRLLVAQGLPLNAVLVTDDAAFHGIPTLRVLRW